MEDNNQNNSNSDWKDREVGALWKKSGRTQNYFSGRVNLKNYQEEGLVNIVGFANKMKKDNPNAPDVILYYSAPSSGDSFNLKSSDGNQSPPKADSSSADSSSADSSSADSSVEDEAPF
jgi:hypothetical protein